VRVVITKTALSNLEHGLIFMREKHSEKLCLEVGEEVIRSTNNLIKNPKIGQTEQSLLGMKLGHRRILVGHFKIIYRLVKDQDIILITDIFDSRQDPNKIAR